MVRTIIGRSPRTLETRRLTTSLMEGEDRMVNGDKQPSSRCVERSECRISSSGVTLQVLGVGKSQREHSLVHHRPPFRDPMFTMDSQTRA